MIILYNRFDETLEYAISELKRCVGRMSGYTLFPTDRHVPTLPTETENGVIRLGLLSDLGLPTDGVKDAYVDDVIDINIVGMSGYIAGSNIRSILLGVYRWLRFCGARWVRPGDDGEYLPYCDFASHTCVYRHAASHRYRGECIEGAVSYENVRDHVIWSPRVGFNLFFIQQIVPFNIISRRYFRKYNPQNTADPRTFEEVAEYTKKIELLTKKCGLQLHLMGHGFMFERYGIHYHTPDWGYELNELGTAHSALVGGKRGLFHNSPNFTQLCFSNDDARQGMVKFCADYIERKPYCDFLQVWLADSRNNHCECENCRRSTPSDLYVKALNELDAELTKRGIKTRIVFIMYNETVFPPTVEKLINPDRFILLTAFSRSYSKPYTTEKYTGELPKFELNNYNVPSDFAVNHAFFNEWRKQFDGDAIIFTYYFYTAHYSDPGQMSLIKTIAEDQRRMAELGFCGTISCHTQRCSFPHALAPSVLAESLFDTSFDLEAFTADYFKAAYGENADKVKTFFDELTVLLDEDLLRDTRSVVEQDTGTFKTVMLKPWKDNPEAAEKFARVPELVSSVLPMIENGEKSATDSVTKKSYRLLGYYARYMSDISKALTEAANGEAEKASALYEETFDRIRREENEWESDLDLMLFERTWKSKFN